MTERWIPRKIAGTLTQSIQSGRKVIIVYGPRQVGKTSLLHRVIKDSGLSASILLGDEQHVKDSFSRASYERMMEAVGENQVVFIDEAQDIEDIGKNIKILHDKDASLRIILSGSSSFQLANDLQEPLTGRKKTFLLYPIALSELLDDGMTRLELRNQLSVFLRYGL